MPSSYFCIHFCIWKKLVYLRNTIVVSRCICISRILLQLQDKIESGSYFCIWEILLYLQVTIAFTFDLKDTFVSERYFCSFKIKLYLQDTYVSETFFCNCKIKLYRKDTFSNFKLLFYLKLVYKSITIYKLLIYSSRQNSTQIGYVSQLFEATYFINKIFTLTSSFFFIWKIPIFIEVIPNWICIKFLYFSSV